ncbi:MAG: YybH family protein [Planctomycetota bacterium]|jgi:ketosteroid isomerase-like protein
MRSLLPIAGIALLGGCTSAPTPLSAEDIRAHREMSQEFLDRVHAQDWRGLSEMYAEDAVVMQPSAEALVGRQAIHDYWASMPPIRELRFHDDGIVGEGDLAYVHGRYWLTFDLPGAPSDHGKYLDVRRRRADGTWEYVAEMANSSLPPEGSEDRHDRVPPNAGSRE